ncbi:MAG TPA: M48 family metalloprotease [Candidatus Polarisedimenticolaceae bacterium]|nr:M48 family metalloprotease [Candidatus Polarisedimenticolaceae bacterium]
MHPHCFRIAAAAGSAALAALLAAGCSVNPATGKQQINIISENQEIQMGREADQQVVAEMGLYDDPKVQAYVARLGKELAAHSERPNLPWSFKVVDDPAVNAFALPGGYIYVTRGLMTHMTNEAELVSVIGHEIGHVTARHSVNQMSKQQLANIGLIAGAIFRPDIAQGPLGQLAGQGLGLAFLKFSRDDERQADELGLRYLRGENYDPRQMAEVFKTLERVGEEAGPGAKVPNWMSTHPAPAERYQTVQKALEGVQTAGLKVNEEPYLEVVDGMVFGQDPREGFFKNAVFYHPEMKFQFTFPQGWKTQNTKSAVAALAPDKDAMVQITLAEGTDPQAAAQKFFGQKGLQAGQGWTNSIGGKPAVTGTFQASTEQGDLRGAAAFVSHNGRVFQILGYTPAARWGKYQGSLQTTLASFDDVSDPSVLNVQPLRVDVIRAPRNMTLATFESQYPSPVNIQKLALINGLEPNANIQSGELVKRVVGDAAVSGS